MLSIQHPSGWVRYIKPQTFKSLIVHDIKSNLDLLILN